MTNQSFAFPCLASCGGPLQSSQQPDESTETPESFESVVAKLFSAAKPDSSDEIGLSVGAESLIAADAVTDVATTALLDSESNQDLFEGAGTATGKELSSTQSVSDAAVGSGTIQAMGNHFELQPLRIQAGQGDRGADDGTRDTSDVVSVSAGLPLSSLEIKQRPQVASDSIEGDLASADEGDVSDDSESPSLFAMNGQNSQGPSVGIGEGFENATQVSSQGLSFGSDDASEHFDSAGAQVVSAGIEGVNVLEASQTGGSEEYVSASSSTATHQSLSGSTSVNVDSGHHQASAGDATKTSQSPGSASMTGERFVQDASMEPNANASRISQINMAETGETRRTGNLDSAAQGTESSDVDLAAPIPPDSQIQPALDGQPSDVLANSGEAVAVAAANVAGGRRGRGAAGFDGAQANPTDGASVGLVNAGTAGDESINAASSGVTTVSNSASASVNEAESEVAITDSSPRQIEESSDEVGEYNQSSTESVDPELVADSVLASESSGIAIGDLNAAVDLDPTTSREPLADTSSIPSQSESPQVFTAEGRLAHDQYSQIQSSSDAQIVETLSLEDFLHDLSSPVAVKKTSEVIGEAMASSLRLDGKTVELELHPADLGMLKIQVTQHEHSIEAQIIATEFTTSELLLGQRDQLMDALADLGFDTSDVHIFHDDQSSGESKQQKSSDEFSFQSQTKASVPANRISVSSGGVNIVA